MNVNHGDHSYPTGQGAPRIVAPYSKKAFPFPARSSSSPLNSAIIKLMGVAFSPWWDLCRKLPHLYTGELEGFKVPFGTEMQWFYEQSSHSEPMCLPSISQPDCTVFLSFLFPMLYLPCFARTPTEYIISWMKQACWEWECYSVQVNFSSTTMFLFTRKWWIVYSSDISTRDPDHNYSRPKTIFASNLTMYN